MGLGAEKAGPHRKPAPEDVANFHVTMESGRIVLAPVANQGLSLRDLLLAAGDPDGSLTQGVTVSAEIVAEGAGQKVIVFKKRGRNSHRRKKGHRQQHTILRISNVRESAAEEEQSRKAGSEEGIQQKVQPAADQSEEIELRAVAAELERAAARMSVSLDRAIDTVRSALDTDREATIRSRFEAELSSGSIEFGGFVV